MASLACVHPAERPRSPVVSPSEPLPAHYAVARDRAQSSARIVLGGILLSAILALVKFSGGILGHSYALIADGTESLLDVLSSSLVWAGFRVAARPPDAANETNRTVDILVAADGLACTREKSTLTLIAVGQWPDIDPASVTFFPDEGRLEFKGTHLEQSQILWQLADQNGEESCLVPLSDGRLQHCIIPLNHKLPI